MIILLSRFLLRSPFNPLFLVSFSQGRLFCVSSCDAASHLIFFTLPFCHSVLIFQRDYLIESFSFAITLQLFFLVPLSQVWLFRVSSRSPVSCLSFPLFLFVMLSHFVSSCLSHPILSFCLIISFFVPLLSLCLMISSFTVKLVPSCSPHHFSLLICVAVLLYCLSPSQESYVSFLFHFTSLFSFSLLCFRVIILLQMTFFLY